MRFAIFPLHLSKVLRLPRKIDARSYEVLHLSRKIILANLQIGCSKMHPPSGNQRPDLLTSLMNMSFVLRLPREMHLGRSSSNAPRLPWFLEMRQNRHVLLTFDKVHNPLRLPRETASEPPKVARACGVLYILTSKCASRHNDVHFFDISTSKSGPTLVCFVHFDFEMCFAPQRRALFRHLNFQKFPKVVRHWCPLCILTSKCALRHNAVHFFDISTSKSGPTLVHFDFEMCFAPQRHALFRHLNFQKFPKVVRHWCALCILTSKCASRHNGVHFFDISTSKSGPELVCFAHFDFEMCFAPQRRALFHLSSGKMAPPL